MKGSLVALLIFGWSQSAIAQVATYRGTASCVKSGCHQKEKDWFEKEDGPPPNQHRSAFEQLTRDLDKSKKYAGSIGLTDPQDPGGRCVECHAPPQRTRFRDGGSCEVCHGPGSAYYDIHDDDPYKTNGYPKSLKLGMFPLLDTPSAWAERCMNCHVLQEAKLIAAGHPSGDDFDLGNKFRVVQSPNGNHWKNNYTPRADEIRKLAGTFGDRIRGLRKGAAPVPTAAAAPPAPPPAPAAVPAAPPVPMPIPVPPAINPPPVAVAPPPAAPPPTAAPISSPGARPASPAAPIAAPPPPAAPRPVPGRPAPATATAAPAPAVAPGAPPATGMAAVPAAVPSGPMARSPAALVAAVQGRAIELLTTLLQRGGVAPVRAATPGPSTYTGPDAELLQLQREVLQLALTALGTAQSPPDQPRK